MRRARCLTATVRAGTSRPRSCAATDTSGTAISTRALLHEARSEVKDPSAEEKLRSTNAHKIAAVVVLTPFHCGQAEYEVIATPEMVDKLEAELGTVNDACRPAVDAESNLATCAWRQIPGSLAQGLTEHGCCSCTRFWFRQKSRRPRISCAPPSLTWPGRNPHSNVGFSALHLARASLVISTRSTQAGRNTFRVW